MSNTEFENYIENISVLDRFKKAFHTLSIEWETDVTKIDFSVLASEPTLPTTPGTRLKIEWIKIENIQHDNLDLFIPGEIERFVELFKFIERGVKIIPPFSERSIAYVDGKALFDEAVSPISVWDGRHRIRLARHLNLTEVPVLFIETPYKGTFSKADWDLNRVGASVVFKNKHTGAENSFPLANCHFQLTLTGDYSFTIH